MSYMGGSPTSKAWINIVPTSSIRHAPLDFSDFSNNTLSSFGSSSSSSGDDTSTSVDNSNSIGNDSYTNANGGAVNSTNNPDGAGCSSGDIGTTLGIDTSVGGVGNAEGLIDAGGFHDDNGMELDRDESIIDDKGHSIKKGASSVEKNTKENCGNGDNGKYSLMSFYFYCYCI